MTDTSIKESKEQVKDPNIIHCGLCIENWENISTKRMFDDTSSILAFVLSKLPIKTELRALPLKQGNKNIIAYEIKILKEDNKIVLDTTTKS